MTPEQAIEFAPKLPSGWLAIAQEKLRYMGHFVSEGQISKVKNGKSQNQVIEDVLFEVAKEEADRLAKVSERIASI